MPTWAIVLLIVAAAAAIFFYMKHHHRKHPMQSKAIAAHKSSKHGWRHRLGGIAKLSENIPGVGGYVKQAEQAASLASSAGVI